MKKIIFSLSFLLFYTVIFSQTDTLYLMGNKKVSCKITEINTTEIKYKLTSNIEGPMYVIDKSVVSKYRLAGGFTELIVPDELSIEHEHDPILQNRSAIKIQPFSPAFSHIALAYESVIKIGMNLDMEVGFINSNINSQYKPINLASGNNSTGNSGAYFKPGIKFYFGEDYSVKGLRYAHPLKGRYIRLDLAVSYIGYHDLSRTYYGNYNNGSAIATVYSNMRTVAYGGFVNYGRQFILGNVFTLDYFFGVGFTAQSISYTNRDFFTNPFPNSNSYSSYNGEERPDLLFSYHGFLRIPGIGMSFTTGFRLGYIIPHNDNKKRKPITQ